MAKTKTTKTKAPAKKTPAPKKRAPAAKATVAAKPMAIDVEALDRSRDDEALDGSAAALADHADALAATVKAKQKILARAKVSAADGQRLAALAAALRKRETTWRNLWRSSDTGSVAKAREPARLGREVLCLQMEDHYVRLHTPLGSELVLMSLSQAMAGLADLDGRQTHRSWWVATAAVVGVVEDGRNLVLKLKGGLTAPVSRARVAPLRAEGWLAAPELSAGKRNHRL